MKKEKEKKNENVMSCEVPFSCAPPQTSAGFALRAPFRYSTTDGVRGVCVKNVNY